VGWTAASASVSRTRADELGDERVVRRQLLEHALPVAVAAESPTCASVSVPACSSTNATVAVVPMPATAGSVSDRSKIRALAARHRLLRDALLAAPAARRLLDRRGREPRRELARLRAAHPVRDREERRLAHERVLVLPALAPVSVSPAARPTIGA
jgi:hypothetical protein